MVTIQSATSVRFVKREIAIINQKPFDQILLELRDYMEITTLFDSTQVWVEAMAII